jgi:excisionase family DNA binding protein
MNTISVGSPTLLLSIPEVAWLLGVEKSRVCRLIRVGVLPVVRRRSRVLVPAHVVAHLAHGTSDGRGLKSAGGAP